MRVGLQLEFFDQAPVTNFAPEPGNLVSAEYVVDKTGLLLSLFLLFRDDGNFSRVVGVDSDFEDALPVAQLALIEGGWDASSVFAYQQSERAAAGGDNAVGLFVRHGPIDAAGVSDVALDPLEGIECGIIPMLIGDGSQEQFVHLFGGERSLIRCSGLSS